MEATFAGMMFLTAVDLSKLVLQCGIVMVVPDFIICLWLDAGALEVNG